MENGHYIEVEKTIHHEAIQPVKEQYHYETIREYANGGKDVIKVIDVEAVEGKEAYDEVIKERVFVEYTQKEKDLMRIAECKDLLAKSDYKAIKFAEGLLTAEEYAQIKVQRQGWRDEINALERKY